MSDVFNPFAPENMSTGFGWDGKTVTVTKSCFQTDYMGRDDNPWIDPNTGERGFNNVWAISGVHEDSESERTERYSIGKSNWPTEDGEGFERRDGKPASLNSRSAAAKFSKLLAEAGFDVSRLMVNGEIKASGLVGAIILFKGEQKKDRDGNPKQDKNGYDVFEYWPTKFLGFAEGMDANPAEAGKELEDLAYDVITTLLNETEGKSLTRIALIQGLNAKLKGDPQLTPILQLASKEAFNASAPWKVDGTTISL